MHSETRIYLMELRQAMERLDLWQAVPPSPEAFSSQAPFSLDTLSPEEWLQWIFIPRMSALIESQADLPREIAISPYIEEALKEYDDVELLLAPLRKIEVLLQR